MGFLKKFSRSRSNSNSYIDDDYERPPQAQHVDPSAAPHSRSLDLGDAAAYAASGVRPPTSYKSPPAFDQSPSAQRSSSVGDKPSPNSAPTTMYGTAGMQRPAPDSGYASQRGLSNGGPAGSRPMAGRDSGYADDAAVSTEKPGSFAAPDLLTKAFNEALRPYTEKIEQLEQQLQDMQQFLDQMESQRMDVFAWIDKRGLRPDVPPNIAKQMDLTPTAAADLNAQLDRKITIVNFDLHRLQDDLNDSISSAHFASAMAKFLPDIQRLSDIRAGPKYAYELIIKLVGNLNSHGGLESVAPGVDEREVADDRRARQDFYDKMDEELLEVIQRRNQEGDDWGVVREVKRLEKNGAYLKNLGIDSYFPRSLDAMRRMAGGGYGAGAQPSPASPRF